MIRRHPRSPLFPYTPLFRSSCLDGATWTAFAQDEGLDKISPGGSTEVKLGDGWARESEGFTTRLVPSTYRPIARSTLLGTIVATKRSRCSLRFWLRFLSGRRNRPLSASGMKETDR